MNSTRGWSPPLGGLFPLYGKERVVRIILECILVNFAISLYQLFHVMHFSFFHHHCKCVNKLLKTLPLCYCGYVRFCSLRAKRRRKLSLCFAKFYLETGLCQYDNRNNHRFFFNTVILEVNSAAVILFICLHEVRLLA